SPYQTYRVVHFSYVAQTCLGPEENSKIVTDALDADVMQCRTRERGSIQHTLVYSHLVAQLVKNKDRDFCLVSYFHRVALMEKMIPTHRITDAASAKAATHVFEFVISLSIELAINFVVSFDLGRGQ
ncbi:hypothetical protein, partial [Enterococcus faecalis]|uniref:hypothetical protein n=1 Tax=Enterococcus faecalis TaxID=1351 RepID=UPI0025B04C7A